jgi:hypothetical protein
MVQALISLAAYDADRRMARALGRIGLRRRQHERAANRANHRCKAYHCGSGHRRISFMSDEEFTRALVVTWRAVAAL